MTLLGDEPPKINTGSISPGVISAHSITVGSIRGGIRYHNLATNPLTITWPVTASFTVDNVSPEVLAILTGQPQGETLL